MDEPVLPGVPSVDSNPLCVSFTDDNGMTLAVLRDGENVTVVIEGEIDLLTVSQMSEALSSELAKSPGVLVVDLDGIGFLASMGISALALAEREASERGIDFRVVASSRTTLRPLEITGMTDQLAVYATRREALLGPGAPPHQAR